MEADLELHDGILADVVRTHGGTVFKFLGDGVAAVFDDPVAAVAAAVEGLRRLRGTAWRSGPLRARMGIHRGPAVPRDGDWYGPTVNRAARLHAVAHGEQLVVSAAIAEVSGLPPGLELVDLGEHKLRDLVEPERIFQVQAPDLPRTFAPLRTERHPVRGVPVPRSRLVGRASELQRLNAAVSAHRLVTLAGPPGTGKTRLAIELARSRSEPWPGGLWFCSLSDVPPSEGGGDRVASALTSLIGAYATDASSALTAITSALEQRKALIVLDGCDHVVDEVGALAAAITQRCEGTTVLSTTRVRLGLPDEFVLTLEGLDQRAGRELLVDRSSAQGTTFDPADAPLLARLVESIDGLPLAIELLAGQLRTDTLDGVLQRLEQTGPVVDPRVSWPVHQRALDASIESSLARLPVPTRELFSALGVFVGSFSDDEVHRVLPGLDAEELRHQLQVLADASLITRTMAGGLPRRPRLRLLHTVRRAAEHRLHDRSDEAELRIRWSRALEDLVAEAAHRLAGPDEARWIHRIAEHWDDLRRHVDDAVRRGDVGTALRLVSPLVHHSTMRGVEVGQWALHCCDLRGFWDDDRAPLVSSMGVELLLRQGDVTGAERLGLRTLERAGDRIDLCWLTHSSLALTSFVSGDVNQGIARIQELLVATGPLREVEPLAPAVAAFVMATVLVHAGAASFAEAPVAQLEDIAAETSCPSILAMAFLMRGRLCQLSDPSAASRCFDEALELALSVDNSLLGTQARWARAEVATSDPARALIDLRALLEELQAGDAAQHQQTLLAALGPVTAVGGHELALQIIGALRSTVWSRSLSYRVARERLTAECGAPAVESAARRARLLGEDRVHRQIETSLAELVGRRAAKEEAVLDV